LALALFLCISLYTILPGYPYPTLKSSLIEKRFDQDKWKKKGLFRPSVHRIDILA
jgi:hypothetical protein